MLLIGTNNFDFVQFLVGNLTTSNSINNTVSGFFSLKKRLFGDIYMQFERLKKK